MRLHVDLETFGKVNLPKQGLDRYLADSSFEITLTALALDDGPVIQWEGFPKRAMAALAAIEGLTWHAYNAPFEMGCMRAYGVEVPLHRWRCTMAHAFCRGFSGGLKDVGSQIGLPADTAKLADGQRLVLKFAKPAPRNHLADRYDRRNSPKDWDRFLDYNRQDVVAERTVWRYLNQFPWTRAEQALWELDQQINQRGVPVDVRMAEAAVEASDRWKMEYDRECRRICGLGVGQTGKLLEWLQGEGYSGADLRRETAEGCLE